MPDLVVEIMSPSTVGHDRGYKQALYGRHGVREYWLVDPDAETVEILTHTEQGLEYAATFSRGQTLGSPLFDGLSLELEDIFNQDS